MVTGWLKLEVETNRSFCQNLEQAPAEAHNSMLFIHDRTRYLETQYSQSSKIHPYQMIPNRDLPTVESVNGDVNAACQKLSKDS